MKKNHLITLLSMALVAMFMQACQTTSSGSGEKIRLEMKPKVGESYNLAIKTKQEIKQKVMGMAQNTTQNIDIYFKQTVKDVSADGIATIEATYDRVVYEMNNAMLGTIAFDSKNESGEDNPLTAAFKGMVGAKLTMKMDKQGKVQGLTGFEAMMENMLKEVGDIGGDAVEKLKSSYDEESLVSTMQQMMPIYPDVLIGAGDTWGSAGKLPGEYPLVMETTYKVDNIEDKKCVLTLDGEIKSDGDGKIEQGGMSMELTMDGTQTGTMEISRESGMLERAKMEQDIHGEISMMGMNIPMDIISTITIEPY